MAALDARSSEDTSSYRTDSVVDGSPPFKRSRLYLEKETEQSSNDFGAESGEAISEGQGGVETETHKAQRTGTIPYMASGVLQGQAPSVQHDLESFFYVLYLLPFSYNSPLPGRRLDDWPDTIEAWCTGDLYECGSRKKANILDDEWTFQQLKDNTSEEWRRDHRFFYRLL
ncbi:hypothetical protein BZG36_05737, partial [Bifiguratus adelaidae]